MGYFKCNWNNCLKLLFLLDLGLPDLHTTRFFLNSGLSFILQICWILVRFESVLQRWVDVGGPLGIIIPVQVTVQYNKPSNKIQANFKLYLIRHRSCVTCTRKHLDYIATRILNYATIAGLQNVLSNTVTLCKLTDKPHLNQNI